MLKTTMDLAVATMHASVTYAAEPSDELSTSAVYVLLYNMRESGMFLFHALCKLYDIEPSRMDTLEEIVSAIKEQAFDEDVLKWLECTDPFSCDDTVKFYKQLLAALLRAIQGWKRTLEIMNSSDYSIMCACEEEIEKCRKRTTR